jgi:magnesium-transporting ATPase (P-type)
MQTLQTIAIIASVILVAITYLSIWSKLNNHCIGRYDYKPLNRWTMITASVAMACIWAGVFVVYQENASHPLTLEAIERNARFWESTAANGIVLAAAGLVVGGTTFFRIIYKTSVASGILAAMMLTISGSLFFLTLVAAITAAIFMREHKRRGLW